MEVYTLSGLTYTIPPATTGIIEFSGNSIPIQLTKGSGSVFSPDVLTLNSDNISSGRRKLGMLAYVYETNKIYQFRIDNYETLWNNATGATGPGGPTVVISDFGTTVKNNSEAGIAFINAWTSSTISGVNGFDDTNASWRVLSTGGNGGGTSITGGTFNNNTDTLTLNNSTGGTITITGFTDYYTTGFTFNPSTYGLTIQRNDGLPNLSVDLSILASDVTITGGTYNPSNGTATFTNNTGGTFNVTGFLTGFTDIYVTGGTFNSNNRTLTLTRTDNVNVTVTGFTDVFVTGGTYSSGQLTFTNNTGGTFNVTGLTSNKIILKRIELGTRTVLNSEENLGLYGVLMSRLLDGIFQTDSTLFNNYTGVKIDYYYTYYDFNTGVRTKKYYTTQKINLDFDPNSVLIGINDLILNEFGSGINVNFYCEMYLDLNPIYSSPTQVRLTNTIFNSLNPYKYSRGLNYTGRAEFVRNNFDLPKTINSIESNFYLGWNMYYTSSTSNDIVKNIYNIILEPEFYGPLSGQSQSTILPTLYSDGLIDYSFIIGDGFDGTVNTIALQTDGKILVGGNFENYNTIFNRNIVRLNPNGSIDVTFNSGGGFQPKSVKKILIQPDGKILVGGDFSTYDNISTNNIIRLNSDGSIDNTFNIGTGFDSTVETIVLQSDGKILVGGGFTTYNGNSRNGMVRLNTDGSVDNSFVYGTGFDSSVKIITTQPDGKILVGGDFTTYSGVGTNYIVRLNSDGSVDNTFNIGAGFDNTVQTISIQSDGKILVGGRFTTYSGVGANYIVRLNSDGSIDNTFNIGTGFNTTVNEIRTQSDDKILVGGDFSDYDGTTANFIIRLNTDGSIDNSFIYGTGFDSTVRPIEIDNNNRLIIGGQFTTYNGVTRNSIIRLIYDFNTTREVIKNNTYVETLTSFYSKYKISVNKHGFHQSNNYNFNNFTGELLYDIFGGSPSSITSNSSAPDVNFYASSFLQMIDTYRLYQNGTPGLIYFDGNSENTLLNSLSYSIDNNTTLKYLNNLRDKSYIQVLPYYQDVYILKINVVGNPESGRGDFIDNLVNNYLKINDSSINVNNTYWSSSNTSYMNNENFFLNINPYGPYLVLQSSDDLMYELSQNPNFDFQDLPQNIFLGGRFTQYQLINYPKIVKLNNAGSIYSFFEVGNGFNGNVYSLTQQSDGKILVGGDFTTYSGISVNRIIRLNSNGSIDNTFNIGTGFNNDVRVITIQTDNKILVGGYFTSYNGNSRNRMVRLNTDGSVDNTFNVGTGFSNFVTSIVVQSDNKILVGGRFSNYNGNVSQGIIRLNTDGSVDNTFNVGSSFTGGASAVFDIKIQSDGKILAGGDFTSYNGNSANYIVRLNPNGSIDNTFVIGTGFDSTVLTIAIQTDGKILVGGYFTTYDIEKPEYIIRLNSDGSIDYSFPYSSGFDNVVFKIILQSNGQILVGGDFTNYLGTGVKRIVRLNPNDGSIDGTFVSGDGCDGEVYTILLETPSINVESIYKGKTFKPFVYPLNLDKLTFEVPVTSDNNEFLMNGTKQLRFIIKYTKLQKYDVVTTDIRATIIRGSYDNKFFTVELTSPYSIEYILLDSVSKSKRKQFRPGSVEIYLSFFDVITNETSLIPNYKIIIVKYGDNEIFKLIRDGLVNNNLIP